MMDLIITRFLSENSMGSEGIQLFGVFYGESKVNKEHH